MRFKLTLNRATKQRMLPMDYQYYISAWIYKVIGKADKEFARFLHDKGYGGSESKLYKLFCFSRLNFGKPVLWKEKKLFEIKRHDIFLELKTSKFQYGTINLNLYDLIYFSIHQNRCTIYPAKIVHFLKETILTIHYLFYWRLKIIYTFVHEKY